MRLEKDVVVKEEVTVGKRQVQETREIAGQVRKEQVHIERRETAPADRGDNLRRWRESGQPRCWVESRRGVWTHGEWLSLLDELRASPFWPLDPDAVGAVLEEEKSAFTRRN